MMLQTTLTIIPPHEVHAIVTPLLQRFMPELVGGYSAHITLLNPFAPMHRLQEACEELRAVCRHIPPFGVTLEGYGTFPMVGYMAVQNPEPIREVYGRIRYAFPEYMPYDGKFGEQINPHITIAHLDGESGQLPPDLPEYAPVSFKVDRLHISYGVPQTTLPWITYDVIPLGDQVATG